MFKTLFTLFIGMCISLFISLMPKRWYKNSRIKWDMVGTWLFAFFLGAQFFYFGGCLIYGIYKLVTVGIIYYY